MGLFGRSKPTRVFHGQGARRHERYLTSTLQCVLGEIVDVSNSGLRVRGKGSGPKINEVLHLAVATDRQRVSCSVRVAWRRRVGLRGFEIGLEFVNTSRGARAAIVQLGRFGFVGAADDQPATGAGVGASAGSANGSTSAGASGGTRDACAVTAEFEDLYAILGLEADASLDEIRLSYRKIAMECHPDVSGSPEAAERFAMVAKAYSVLKDAELRSRYDALIKKHRAA